MVYKVGKLVSNMELKFGAVNPVSKGNESEITSGRCAVEEEEMVLEGTEGRRVKR